MFFDLQQAHFKSLLTWFTQFTMSYFLRLLIALWIKASWLSYMTPTSFIALKLLNFALNFEKQNSIGLR